MKLRIHPFVSPAILVLVHASLGAQAALVRDIETAAASRPSEPRGLVNAGGRVLFIARQEHPVPSSVDPGVEVFSTSGQRGDLQLLDDFLPGPRSSTPREFVAVGSYVYFEAGMRESMQDSRGLFRYDRTTGLVAPILQAGSSLHTRYRVIGGTGKEFFLFAGTDSLKYLEYYSNSGLTLLSSSLEADNGAAILANGKCVFAGMASFSDTEPWVADSTGRNTVILRDIVPGRVGSKARGFVSTGNLVYFVATSTQHGEELWVTDGTSAGTTIVADLRSGPASSQPAQLTADGSALYFTADDGTSGRELWRTTGAGATLVRDIAAGAAGSDPGHLTVHAGRLFFAATSGGDRELWTSDGTTTGTRLVVDLRSGASSDPQLLTSAKGGLYFAATMDAGGRAVPRLVRSDGSAAGTAPVTTADLDIREIAAGGSASDVVLVADDGNTGVEIWASSGTAASTWFVGNPNARPGGSLSSDPGELATLGDRVLFAATTLAEGRELWISDGTAANTGIVRNIRPGSLGSDPRHLTRFGSMVVFAADNGAGSEPWRSDGTAAGTAKIADVNATGGSDPEQFTEIGGWLYFVATDDTSRRNLWRTDGTNAGTTRVASSPSGKIGSLTPVGDRLFFTLATSGLLGRLWVTDGTQAGTVPVPFQSLITPTALTATNGVLYFAGDDSTAGIELWRTDGSVAGTRRVKDLNPGTGYSNPRDMGVHEGLLYFLATGPNTRHIFRSDGTSGGTVALATLFGSPDMTVSPGGLLYQETSNSTEVSLRRADFSGGNARTLSRHLWGPNDVGIDFLSLRNLGGGVSIYLTRLQQTSQYAEDSLWITDGTQAGTGVLASPQELAVDAAVQPVLAGNRLFFAAHDGLRGVELYSAALSGSSQPVGTGCAAAGATPRLGCTRVAINQPAELQLDQVPALRAGILLAGAPRTSPFDLGGGCRIHVDVGLPVLALPLRTGANQAWTGGIAALPNDASLVGAVLALQAGVGHPSTPPLGAALSNGVRVTIGR